MAVLPSLFLFAMLSRIPVFNKALRTGVRVDLASLNEVDKKMLSRLSVFLKTHLKKNMIENSTLDKLEQQQLALEEAGILERTNKPSRLSSAHASRKEKLEKKQKPEHRGQRYLSKPCFWSVVSCYN